MIIYLEKQYKNNKIVKKILLYYKDAEVLEIDNYKNIFDKNILWNTKETLILAWVSNAIIEAPKNYGFNTKGYFLKNSLNCIYNCKYCYLKWAFKNNIQVIFVNYKDIKSQIIDIVKDNNNKQLTFYSSDYSDNLAIDNLTNFTLEFIPFFWDLSNNVNMEIRTKSVNIGNLLWLAITKNVEISFSINPDIIIKKYEKKTPWLKLRIKAINKLLLKWWNVWLRFSPLLWVDDYKRVYLDFVKDIKKQIDFSKINSFFVWWLLYTKKDYNKLLLKESNLDLLYKLSYNNGFYRNIDKENKWFYDMFKKEIGESYFKCLD